MGRVMVLGWGWGLRWISLLASISPILLRPIESPTLQVTVPALKRQRNQIEFESAAFETIPRPSDAPCVRNTCNMIAAGIPPSLVASWYGPFIKVRHPRAEVCLSERKRRYRVEIKHDIVWDMRGARI